MATASRIWNPIIDDVPFFWWRTVYLSTDPIESISGFLPTFNYDPVSGYRTSAIRVDDLRPGDPDPRAPEFVVDRIHMILDSESRNACGYLFFRRADGAPMETHTRFLPPWLAEGPRRHRIRLRDQPGFHGHVVAGRPG